LVSPRTLPQAVGAAHGTPMEAVCTESACCACYRWHHSMVVPGGHPLDDSEALTRERLAGLPIFSEHEGFTGR